MRYNALPMDATSPSFQKPVLAVKHASNNIDGVNRALCVGTAGTANLVYDDGDGGEDVVSDYPLQAGYNPLGGIKRINTGGTADDIWLIF